MESVIPRVFSLVNTEGQRRTVMVAGDDWASLHSDDTFHPTDQSKYEHPVEPKSLLADAVARYLQEPLGRRPVAAAARNPERLARSRDFWRQDSEICAAIAEAQSSRPEKRRVIENAAHRILERVNLAMPDRRAMAIWIIRNHGGNYSQFAMRACVKASTIFTVLSGHSANSETVERIRRATDGTITIAGGAPRSNVSRNTQSVTARPPRMPEVTTEPIAVQQRSGLDSHCRAWTPREG